MLHEQTHDIVKLTVEEIDTAHAMIVDLNCWLEGEGEGGAKVPSDSSPADGSGGVALVS